MGRYCYFGNGFQYKFWVGVQDSGFGFLNNAGVKENISRIYDLHYWLENNSCDHLFCATNCDKEITNPCNMVRFKDCLFCDDECRNNFNEEFTDEEVDMEYQERKYHFAVWAKTYAGNGTFSEDELKEWDGYNADWDEFLEESLCEDNFTFTLDVDREKLLTHIESYGFELPKFDDYAGTTDGTDKMYANLCVNMEHTDKNADFCLACIVYHMSSYDDDICGEYQS